MFISFNTVFFKVLKKKLKLIYFMNLPNKLTKKYQNNKFVIEKNLSFNFCSFIKSKYISILITLIKILYLN